jgi:predicted metal-binding membrane protein
MKAPCLMQCEVDMVMIDSKWRISVRILNFKFKLQRALFCIV